MKRDRPDDKELLVEVRTNEGRIYRIYTDSTLEGFGDGTPLVINYHWPLMDRAIAQVSLAKEMSGAPVLDTRERTEDRLGGSHTTAR